MTPDTTGETVDGMSREKIKTMIDLIRQERWRWTPVKRIYIPKRIGKLTAAWIAFLVVKSDARSGTASFSMPTLNLALAIIRMDFAQDGDVTAP